jgi:hypothetical protein
VLERCVLFISEFLCIKSGGSPYRLACVPAAPRKIQELFLLELRLFCGDVRTIAITLMARNSALFVRR